MSLSPDDIQRMARLSRIAVSDTELARFGQQLNSLFGLIEKLQAVDTTGIEPMSHARDVALRLRDDTVNETDQRAAFQAIAPAVSDGLYLVPKVID